MELNEDGINIIKYYEKCRLTPYYATTSEEKRGTVTIGWGMTFYPDGTSVKINDDPLTQEEANDLFRLHLVNFSKELKRYLRQDTTDNQFSALLSTAYNTGVPKLISSQTHIIAKHNDSDIDGVYEIYPKCRIKQDDEELQGLINRRLKERELYIKE